MGLAEETGPGQWRIDAELEAKLRRMGERGDIIKTMHRELAAAGLSRAAGGYTIFDPGAEPVSALVGRVVGEGFADELRERRYVVVDGIDGRTHYAEIGSLLPIRKSRRSGTRLSSSALAPRSRAQIDRTIAEIAAANDGRYSDHLHREFDPQASSEYVASHVRRLEAMRREGMVSRLSDGSWSGG